VPPDDRVEIRTLNETDLGEIVALDERITGTYRPAVWDRRLGYYIRRDPEGSLVAELDGRVVGFIVGEVRAGEFGLEEPTGWIEVVGVDPDARGLAIGRRLTEGLERHFRARGAQTMRTLVDEESHGPLVRFFSSVGFEEAPVTSLVRRLDGGVGENAMERTR
jgi:ribosomal protein S18 acetylase RimI-like enzyme